MKYLNEALTLQESGRRRGIPAGTAGPVDAWLGEGYLILHQSADALRCAERLLEASHIGYARAIGLYLQGRLTIHSPRSVIADKESPYYEALRLLTRLGMRPWIAHCHLGLSNISARTGEREPAKEHLATAIAMYREMHMTYWLEKAEAEIAALNR